MKIKKIIGVVVFLSCVGGLAHAGDAEELVQLDKQWGEALEAAALDSLLADGILSIGPEGKAGKAELMEAAASAEAPTGPYVADDYDVQFLSDDTAIMVHSASTPDAHWSMHVWKKTDGKWQVAATATAPTAH